MLKLLPLIFKCLEGLLYPWSDLTLIGQQRRPSSLVSTDMHEFLLQESSAFMVSQRHLATAGDPSKFSGKWCNDSEAKFEVSRYRLEPTAI